MTSAMSAMQSGQYYAHMRGAMPMVAMPYGWPTHMMAAAAGAGPTAYTPQMYPRMMAVRDKVGERAQK